MKQRFRLHLSPAWLLCILLVGAASGRASEAGLSITFDQRTVAVSRSDLARLPHQEVSAFDSHDKNEHIYSGVPVRDLLASAGVPLGDRLRGKSLRLAVYVHCRDDYDIVFALAEFDEAFNSRTILLVDRQDGQPLPEGMGPLRLVVPGDKRPARWARMVTGLEIVAFGEPKPATDPAPAPNSPAGGPNPHPG